MLSSGCPIRARQRLRPLPPEHCTLPGVPWLHDPAGALACQTRKSPPIDVSSMRASPYPTEKRLSTGTANGLARGICRLRARGGRWSTRRRIRIPELVRAGLLPARWSSTGRPAPRSFIASRMGHADTQVLFRPYIKEFDAQDREAAREHVRTSRAARAAREAERPSPHQMVRAEKMDSWLMIEGAAPS